ncbi:hypothetical protein ACX1N5_13965 [Acinetobacter sp. ANC 4636]
MMNMAGPQKLSQEIENDLKAFCKEHSLNKQQYQRLCDIADKAYLLAEQVAQAEINKHTVNAKV